MREQHNCPIQTDAKQTCTLQNVLRKDQTKSSRYCGWVENLTTLEGFSYLEQPRMVEPAENRYYESRGTVHYNVHFKSGGSLEGQVTDSALCGLRPADIDWLWIVEESRRATPDEIRKLCKASGV